MRKKKLSVILIVLMVNLLFCSSGNRLRFYQPARQNLIGIKQLVLAPCEGNHDAALLCSYLTSAIEQTSYFSLFDQNEFTAALQQRKLSYENLKQADSLVQIGLLLDLDAIIFSELKSIEIFPDESGVETVAKSVWTGEYERDANGTIIEEMSPLGEVVKKKKYKLQNVEQHVRIRTAKIQANFAVIDLKKGGRLITQELTENYVSAKSIVEENQQLPAEDGIKRTLAQQVVTRFFKEIAPKEIFLKRAIEKGTALLDSGAVHARKGAWQNASEFWTVAQKSQPTDARIYFNLGIASEAMGDYDLAISYYKKAALLNPKKKVYQQASENLKKLELKK